MSDSGARNRRMVVSGGQSCKCFLFHCEVTLDVTVSGDSTFVTKPKRDDVKRHARLCEARRAFSAGWAPERIPG